MTWGRVIVYWVCFAALSAYYFAALRQPSGPAIAHLTRAPFLDIAQEHIDRLQLKRGGTVIRCRRDAGRWHLIEPAGATVPADLIAALVSNLSDLPDVEVVAEKAADLAQFGLAPPMSQLVLGTGSGKSIVVRLGARNPSGTAVYAQRGDDPRVFLIGLNIRYYEDLVFQTVGASGSD